MPEEVFRAQWELLTMAYIASNRERELNRKFIIYKMAKTFQVTDKMIQARLAMLEIK